MSFLSKIKTEKEKEKNMITFLQYLKLILKRILEDMDDEFHGTVVIFTKANCIESMKASMTLKEMDIPFIEVPIDSEPNALEELSKFVSDEITTPHIFFNDKHIPGYSQLVSLMKNNAEWEELIQQTKNIEASENAPKLSIIDEAKNKRKVAEAKEKENGNSDRHEWIPSQYDKLVSMMRKANLIKDNRVSVTKTYRNSFKGEDFIGWIMREKKIRRSEALELGQELIETHFNEQMSHDEEFGFDPQRYYQLADEADSGPLNLVRPPTNKFPTDLGEFNEILKKFIDPIYETILDENRKCIYVERLEDNLDFKHYMILMRETINLNIEKSSLESRLAFFTNCYNMQLIHITYKCGLPTTIWQRRRYLYSIYYQIGEHLYSLQSIFNGILRGNQKGYGMLWKPFGKQDKRRPFVITYGEPLIHFAINTFNMSTPAILAYSTKNVAEEMYHNAQRHLESDAFLRIDSKKNIIHLAKLFKIYGKDFGTGIEAILEWVIDVMKPGPKRDDLIKLYYTGQYTIAYLPMDFTSNFLRDDNNI